MAGNAHDAWTNGAFALKPLPAESQAEIQGKVMRLQFFWQPKYDSTQSRISLLTTPTSSEELEVGLGGTTLSVTTIDGRKASHMTISTGFVFEIRTKDSERSLPSRELLEMQRALQRVWAMRGAAENDPDNDDFRDNEKGATLIEEWINETQIDDLLTSGEEPPQITAY